MISSDNQASCCVKHPKIPKLLNTALNVNQELLLSTFLSKFTYSFCKLDCFSLPLKIV